MEKVAKKLPKRVDRWLETVKEELAAILPRGDLGLATSVFRRGEDPTPLTFPRMLLVPHTLSCEFGPQKYSTASGPWTMAGLRHDAVGAAVVEELCSLAGLDAGSVSVEQMDASPVRVHCALCIEPWPAVLTWRQAVR